MSLQPKYATTTIKTSSSENFNIDDANTVPKKQTCLCKKFYQFQIQSIFFGLFRARKQGLEKR